MEYVACVSFGVALCDLIRHKGKCITWVQVAAYAVMTVTAGLS